MISLDEARRFVLRDLEPLAPVELDLTSALGTVAASVVVALEPSPRFENSSMDGYALRALDTVDAPARLRITSTIFAGDEAATALGRGEAMRIMTGAPIPPGADSVCLREDTLVDEAGRSVLIEREVALGEAVRRVGDDVAVGQVLVRPGDEIGPAFVGVLASQGLTSVRCHPRPRVGVLSTGNELARGSSAVRAGMIRDTNGPSLLASLRASGFEGVDLGIAGDTPEAITEAFRQGLDRCDALVSTGGVSVGDADFVKAVIADLCGETSASMQVALKPGKPFAFGLTRDGKKPLFGLAGNPVSTLVGFEAFVRPALRRLGGHRTLDRLTVAMVLDCPLARQRDGRLHWAHVVARRHDDGRVHVEGVARQASHLLHAVARANAIAFVPDGDGLETGELVRGMIIEPDTLSHD